MSRSRRSSKQKSRKASQPVRDFWGSLDSVPDLVTSIRPTPDASGIVRSLGEAPLAGHGTISEHYFRAVYDRASGLAIALAAGSGLLDTDSEDF